MDLSPAWSAGASLAAAVVVGAVLLPGPVAGPAVVASVLTVVSVAVAASLWRSARGRGHVRLGWQLLALAVLAGVLADVPELVLRGGDLPAPLDLPRTLLPLPGAVLTLLALLALLDRRELRACGARLWSEVALFGAGVVVLTQVLAVSPAMAGEQLGATARVALEVAAVAIALVLCAALTLLAHSTGPWRRAAVVLLVALVLLVAGEGLTALTAHEAALGGRVRPAVGGLLEIAGLVLLTVAARRPQAADAQAGTRAGQAGELLPHLVLGLAASALVGSLLLGARPSPAALLAALACAVLTAVHRWLTARDAAELDGRLRDSEAHFRSLVRSQSDAALILDDGARVLWAAPSLLALVGASAPAVAEHRLADLVPAADRPALARWLDTVGAAGTHPPFTLRLDRADGGTAHLEATATDLRADPAVRALVLYCRDVTERVEREARLSGLAFTDLVTGLPNRAALQEALTAATAAPGGGEGAAALLLLELAGLPVAQETLGRPGVEAAVSEVGCRLRSVLREGDVVARYTGGAFGVLAHGGPGEIELVAARCLSVVEQPITTDLGLLDLSACVGTAVLERGGTVAGAVDRAELALSAAQAAGEGVVRAWVPALEAARERAERLRQDLVGARARGELGLVFQPIVSLAERTVTGVEALVRWTHPVLGDVPPEEFLPIARRAGLSPDVERWVLAEAASAVAPLTSHGAPLRVGVDVSAAHVAAGTVVDHVAAALRASGLAPERLVVEVNEAWMSADAGRLQAEFSALRLLGVQVALDGFGAQTSSLGHLTQLPLDIVKLDRTFLARIDRDGRTRALVESTIGIAGRLGFDVVAQGIEAPSELAVLSRLGCAYGQGYLLSRPVSLTALTELLDAGAGQLWPGLVGQS